MNPNQLQGHTADEGRATERRDAWIHSPSFPQCHYFPGHIKQWLIWSTEIKKRGLLAKAGGLPWVLIATNAPCFLVLVSVELFRK